MSKIPSYRKPLKNDVERTFVSRRIRDRVLIILAQQGYYVSHPTNSERTLWTNAPMKAITSAKYNATRA